MVNKHTLDYHASPSQLTSRIHPRKFLWTPKGFISPESFLNFLLNLYIPPWLQKSFEFMVKIIGKIHLCVKKMNLSIFTHPPNKTLPQVFIIIPGLKENYPFLKIYFFPSRKEGRGIMELKKLPKLDLRVY